MKKLSIILSLMVALLVAAGSIAWYVADALKPAQPGIGVATVRITIESGEGVAMIAEDLKSHGVIRNEQVFRWYVELTGARAKLKAGSYALSPALSAPEIVEQLIEGKTSELNVLIPPGLTLAELKNILIKAGFTAADVDIAYAATYSGVAAERPTGASLEGYIYPETYRVPLSASAQDVINVATQELDQVMTPELRGAFAARGLTPFQAVILASIVQKETTDPADQPTVAQVFLKRLAIGMELGSDVTFIYAAKQLGVAPSVNLDSPYNTRRYKGLPPGPISNVTLTALQAVANPAGTDYLYFVAGDDGKTYFAHTFEQHEQNIANYCHTLCD